jgi:hypothetical protein
MQGAPSPQDFPRIGWRRGPLRLLLDGEVVLRLPDNMVAVQGAEMRRFLEASGNRVEGRELAVAGPDDLRWFAIVSRAPAGTARRRAEWVEHFVEPDGRRSVLRTVVLPAGGELLQVEILSEEDNASLAALESELLLRAVEAGIPRTWWWPPTAVAALAALWLLYKRRLTASQSKPGAA